MFTCPSKLGYFVCSLETFTTYSRNWSWQNVAPGQLRISPRLYFNLNGSPNWEKSLPTVWGKPCLVDVCELPYKFMYLIFWPVRLITQIRRWIFANWGSTACWAGGVHICLHLKLSSGVYKIGIYYFLIEFASHCASMGGEFDIIVCDRKWNLMKSNDRKRHLMTENNIWWQKMTYDDRKWHMMTENDSKVIF